VLPVPESEHGKLDTAGAAVAAVAVEATPKPTADAARAAAAVRRNTRRAITEVSDQEGDCQPHHRTGRAAKTEP